MRNFPTNIVEFQHHALGTIQVFRIGWRPSELVIVVDQFPIVADGMFVKQLLNDLCVVGDGPCASQPTKDALVVGIAAAI